MKKPDILTSRIARPYGGHLVVRAPNQPGAQRFVDRIVRWLTDDPNLSLFPSEDTAAVASEREIEDVIAASSHWDLSPEERRLLPGLSIAYAPVQNPPVDGDSYKAGIGIELRSVSYFVAHAHDPDAFRETSQGMAIMLQEATHISEVALATTVGKQLPALSEALSRYGVLHDDMMALLVANALSNEADTSGTYYISVDAILDARGLAKKKKHNKYLVGHHTEARVAVVEAMSDLHNLLVGTDLIERKTRREREWKPVLHIETIVTTDDVDNASVRTLSEFDPKNVSGIHYRLGSWFDGIKALQATEPVTAPRALLGLDAKRDRTAKRLGHYFVQRATTRDHEGRVIRPIRQIFREAGVEVDSVNPQRTRDRFEQALEKLVERRVFAAWGYLDPATHPPLPTYKWLEPWLGLRIWVRLS